MLLVWFWLRSPALRQIKPIKPWQVPKTWKGSEAFEDEDRLSSTPHLPFKMPQITSTCGHIAAKLEHNHTPTANQKKKDNQHESPYIHGNGSLLLIGGDDSEAQR